MLTPPIIVQQMMEFASDELPSRWQTKWEEMQKNLDPEDDNCTLQTWLEEVYFNNDRLAEFTRDDIASAGELIERMLKFEPSARATAGDALAHAWFRSS